MKRSGCCIMNVCEEFEKAIVIEERRMSSCSYINLLVFLKVSIVVSRSCTNKYHNYEAVVIFYIQ